MAFAHRRLDELRIHLLKLMCLAGDGHQEIGHRATHTAHCAKVGVGVNCFRRSSGSKQPGHLRKTFGIGFFRKGKITAVGLAFTGKGFLQTFEARHGVILGLMFSSNSGPSLKTKPFELKTYFTGRSPESGDQPKTRSRGVSRIE